MQFRISFRIINKKTKNKNTTAILYFKYLFIKRTLHSITIKIIIIITIMLTSIDNGMSQTGSHPVS